MKSLNCDLDLVMKYFTGFMGVWECECASHNIDFPLVVVPKL